MALEFPTNPSNGQVYGQYTYDGSYKVWRSTPDLASGLPAGTILQWGTNTAPANWLICDGTAVSRTTYASLYAAIGTNFGSGDGATTFNLPDLRGRVAVGRDSAQTEFDLIGETGGNKATAKYGSGTTTGFGTVYSDSLGATGDATSSNMPPYQVVNHIIKISASVTSSDSDLASRVGVLENKFNTGQNDAPAGAIMQWAAVAAPTNWLLCDGSAVSRATWPSLFAAIGTTYGSGDGSTTFNLPNLKGRVGVGLDSSQTEFDALGETGGAKTHTLLASEMPSHTHDIYANSFAGDLKIVMGPRGGDGSLYSVTDSGNDASNTGSVFYNKNTGGGGAHNNLQPYIVLNYIIKATAGVSTNDSTFVTRVGAVETNVNSKANLAGGNALFGTQTATPTTNAETPLVAQGRPSQTADLQQWKNSSGTNVLSVDAAGRLISPNQPAYYGGISGYGTTTSNYFPTIVEGFNVGFTRSGNNRLTAQVAGKYYVAAQQLINTTGTSVYFNIYKNGGTVAYAYSNADDTYDVQVSALLDLQVNDYIELFYGPTTTYSWPSPHSSFSVFKIS